MDEWMDRQMDVIISSFNIMRIYIGLTDCTNIDEDRLLDRWMNGSCEFIDVNRTNRCSTRYDDDVISSSSHLLMIIVMIATIPVVMNIVSSSIVLIIVHHHIRSKPSSSIALTYYHHHDHYRS